MYTTYMKKNQRKARLRFQFVIILATVMVALTFIVVGGSQMKSHEAQASVAEEVLYKSVQIHSGDTLWSLAEENMGSCYDSKDDYIKEVKEINHITEKEIQSGSYIIIPYASVVE